MNQRNENGRRGPEKGCDCRNAREGVAEQVAMRADAAEERCETARRRNCDFSDPVCVNARQIYDACRDRDCVADQRVYLTQEGQDLLENAINVKLRRAEVIWVYTDVEPLSFNRGYFSVDMKFFVRVTLEIFCGVCNPQIVCGLTTYDKRVILYGSEGTSKVFSSKYNPNSRNDLSETWQKVDRPIASIEVVEPVALSARFVEEDRCECDCCCENDTTPRNPFPEAVCDCFGGDLVVDDSVKKVLVTYGLFFMVRLERDTQLLIDAVDFCIPTQECSSATEESPCALFNDIRFPVDEFFPPQKSRCQTVGGCDCCN